MLKFNEELIVTLSRNLSFIVQNSKKVILLLLLVGFIQAPTAWGLSLMEAIEQSAQKIVEELPPKSRVAIIAFESPNDNLSDYIMDELTGSLVGRGMEVADRRNMDYVYKELKFQMSGDVSDETAQSIGKFLGAQLVITGQLTSQGKNYRYRTSAIHVEKATLAAVIRFDVDNNKAMQNLVTTLAKQKTTVKTAKYGVDEKTAPKTAGTFLDRGILFATRGDYEMAITDFTEAIELAPNLAAAYMLRGRALFASVSKVIEQEDNFRSVEIELNGMWSLQEPKKIQSYEKAIADFTQSIRLDPGNAVAYTERGITYQQKGDFDKALADLTQAIRLDPNNAERYRHRGDVYHNTYHNDRAIADFTQAIKLDPNNADRYKARGFAYAFNDDPDRAIVDFTQAIKLDPNNADRYRTRGISYRDKRDYDKALTDFTHAIKLDPNNADRYADRGYTYSRKEDYDQAIADYTQAIKLDPNNADRYTDRGYEYYGKKDYDRAIADFTQAIKLDPNNADRYKARGNAYLGKKDYDRAIADFTQAIKLDPDYVFFYGYRGDAYLGKKDYDRAIADYEAVLRIYPVDDYKKNLDDARRARGR